jgi:hypothetical protein
MNDSEMYGAADPDLEKAVAWFDERISAYYEHIVSNGILDLWRVMNQAVFAGFYTGGEIGRLGKQGEFLSASINDLGNLHHHLFTLITGQRPAFEARTLNADADQQQQAPIGVAVVETAWREKQMESRAKEVADTMLRAGEAYCLKRWDPLAGPTFSTEPETDPDGQPVLDEQGQPRTKAVPSGDVEFRTFHPIDVPRDIYRSGADQRWRATRRWENRWDLVAAYPELRDKILSAPVRSETGEGKRPLLVEVGRTGHVIESDDVAVYDCYVERCPAVPEGRLLTFLAVDCVLFDGPLPYRRSPLYRACAKELEGHAFGYTLFWDVLAPQMAANNLHSSLLSIARVAGIPSVWQPDGNGLRQYAVGALKVLQGGTVKPEVLDFLGKAPIQALVSMIETYGAAMERMSGINATFRGIAGEGQKGLSGAAYALFAARTIEFASTFQSAYNGFLEEIATATINDYQDMGAGEYLITIAGEGNAYRVDKFKAADISGLSRISLRLTNPMQATAAGRQQLFDSLLQLNKESGGSIIPDARTAVTLLQSGRLEPATQAAERERENISKENERLGKGEPVVSLITDRHDLHIPEHLGVVASPEARENAAIVQAATAHILEHAQHLRMVDPVILAIQGVKPEVMQAIAMSMAPPPMPGAGDGTPPPEGGETSGTPMPMDAGAAAAEAAGMPQPSMPEPPMNPLSGEAAPMPQGA